MEATMGFEWLGMRIAEERERREREMLVLERLPLAVEELYRDLLSCIEEYAAAFGPESAEASLQQGKILVTVRDEQDGAWQPRATVEITEFPKPPGFRVERDGEVMLIEIGMLPGAKLFYKIGDQYLTGEDLTRRVLDAALFPKLTE